MSAPSNIQLVCLLDVLGFENILQRIGLASLRSKYEALIEYVAQQTGGIDVVPTPDGHVAVGWLVVGNAYFSDTLLFWTDYNPMALPSFSQLAADTFCYGLETELPLRGAIAVGEVVLDRERGVFIGQPLVEAARTERAQEWIGISFGPSFQHPEFNRGFYLNTVMPYKSHYKDRASEYATGMTVDWPRQWRESRKSDPRPIIKTLDRDPGFATYYARSLAFVDFSEKHHDWFRREKRLNYG
jgi:hypothetical protein